MEDLICLCASCHARADKERWGEKTLRKYKLKPWATLQYEKEDRKPNTNPVKVTLIIEDCDERLLGLLPSALAEFLKISRNDIHMESVKENSLRITIRLPKEAAEKLLIAYEKKDPELYKYLGPYVLLDIRQEIEKHEKILKNYGRYTKMALPVKYVLYNHFASNEKQDFEDWKKGVSCDRLAGVKYLIDHFNGLQELLTIDLFEGMLVLLYAPNPSLAHCLGGIAQGKTKNDLMAEYPELKFAHEVQQYVDRILTSYPELLPRFRFVTALDLYDIFGRMNLQMAVNLRWWFVGSSPTIRYDTPKIVEAFVRLRLLGAGVPVFRLDWDVLFRDENKDNKPGRPLCLGLSDAIDSCLSAYKLRLDEPSIATFLFSASYNTNNASTNNDFGSWAMAFATRIFPALPVDMIRASNVNRLLFSVTPELQSDLDNNIVSNTLKLEFANKEITLSRSANALVEDAGSRWRINDGNNVYIIRKEENQLKIYAGYTWDDYARDVFNVNLARKFYGFDSTELTTSNICGIGKIGAHPLVSVISGAMLCFSEGAIIDLPPFSNFGLNVIWIDDHLKYCLHRELRHFTSLGLIRNQLLDNAKLDNVMVQKDRPPITDLPNYVFGTYLPTLLWGTIMDAWITPSPLLKYRSDSLSNEDKILWDQLPRTGESQAILPAAMQRALQKGHIDKGEKQALREKLVEKALKRINEVRDEWANLIDGGQETFASIWAKGTVNSYFRGLDPRCDGIAETNFPLHTSIEKVPQLNHYLYDDFRMLVDDAIDYIEWTLNWPQIIQIVRSIEQGTLRTDMSWNR